jgi:putative flippase GtrA
MRATGRPVVARSPARGSRTTRWEGIRFVAVGVVNTADYYAAFLLLDRVTWYLLAHVVAFVGSSCGSFFLNCRFTYRVRPTWRKFFLFPLTVGVNFAVTTAALAVLVEAWGFDPRVAAIAAAMFAVPFTFLLSRRVLKGHPSSWQI